MGFIILFVIHKKGKIEAKAFWLVIFSFSFALAIGVLWEIFEFSMDQVFGFNMQKSGLIDTMWDLIVDALGAFLSSLAGYLYLKGEDKFSFSFFMNKFIERNPHLFK